MMYFDTGIIVGIFFFEIRCLHPQNCVFVQISCASWRKNLVTQVKPGGKKWLLGGKKWLLGGKKWLLVGKKWLLGGKIMLLSFILQD